MGGRSYQPCSQQASQNVENNYRKVTVMPALGKVFESILNSRLTYLNIALDLDDELQFGFRANAKTTDNIFISNSLIQRKKLKTSLFMYALLISLKHLII